MISELGGRSPVQTACEVLAAIAERRIGDALARVDPEVLWKPVARPARSLYAGHAGLSQLANDLYRVYGPHRLEVDGSPAVAGEPGGADGETRFALRVRVVRQAGGADVTGPPILAAVTIRNGLVTRIACRYEG